MYEDLFKKALNITIHGNLKGINSVLQLLKRSARNYRNVQNFITMIYLRLEHLDFRLPTCNSEEPYPF